MSTFMDHAAFADALGAGLSDVIDASVANTVLPAPQIGDRVTFMDTIPDKLRGQQWYYIGDTLTKESHNYSAVAMTEKGDFLYMRPNTLLLDKAECYIEAANCRLAFESSVSTELVPIGELPHSGVGRLAETTARFGVSTLKPGAWIEFNGCPSELSSLSHLGE